MCKLFRKSENSNYEIRIPPFDSQDECDLGGVVRLDVDGKPFKSIEAANRFALVELDLDVKVGQASVRQVGIVKSL